MPYFSTPIALLSVSLVAFVSLVAEFVASKTHFLVALKWLVAILATNVAILLLLFVWTLAGKVAENSAVTAFNGWVHVLEVPLSLFTHLQKVVVAFKLWLTTLFYFRFCLFFILEVHIALEGATRNNQVRIAFCVKTSNGVCCSVVIVRKVRMFLYYLAVV